MRSNRCGNATFRTIWCASVVANFGQLILGVGAAWEMTRLATADMVALVQTALMLPLMLVSVPAGAIADMFDRRKIALAGLALRAVRRDAHHTGRAWTHHALGAIGILFHDRSGCGVVQPRLGSIDQ